MEKDLDNSVFNAMKECVDLTDKLKAEGKSADYILIYSKGYFQGEYDTKQKLKQELEKLKKENYTLIEQNARMSERHFKDSGKLKELETYKKIAEKLANAVYDYTNLGVLIKCPAEYEGKVDLRKCKYFGKDINCIKCIIDWARKEVEKDNE